MEGTKKRRPAVILFVIVSIFSTAAPLSGEDDPGGAALPDNTPVREVPGGEKPLKGGKGRHTSVVLQLKWYYQFQFAGYVAAREKGYFREEGLAVEIREGGDGIIPLDEVVEGRADFGIENAEALLGRLNGKPVVAVAAFGQHSPLVLLTPKDSGVRTPHDLIGKKVMMGGGKRDSEIVAMFYREGVPLDSITKLGYTLDVETFLDPDIAAIAAYSTNTPYILKKAGAEYTIISPLSYGIDFYSDVLITSEKMMRREPETVLAFRRAAVRGWEYALANPEEIAAILRRNYDAAKSIGHLLFEAGELRNLMLPELVEIGHMSPNRWRRIADTFVELGMTEEDYSLDGFIYEEYLETNSEVLRRIGAVFLAVIAAAMIVALVLFAFNRRLKGAVASRTEALYEKEQDLIKAQEISRVGNWVVDLSDRKVRVSDQFRDIFGLAEGEVTYQQVFDRIHPSYKSIVASVFEDTAARGGKGDIEFRIIAEGGEEKYIRALGEIRPVPDTGGGREMYGTVQDITEKKLAEEQLHIQRDLAVGVGGASTLEEAAALSIFGAMELTNADCGGVYLLNPRTKALEVIHTDGLPENYLEAATSSSLAENIWNRLTEEPFVEVRRDNSTLNALNNASGESLEAALFFPLTYHGKNFGFVLVGVHDRSKFRSFEREALESLTAQIANVILQKQVEEELKLSERRYRGLFESMMDGVVQTDGAGRYLEANDAFLRIVGYSLDELRDMTYLDITPEKWHNLDEQIMSDEIEKRGFSDEFEKEYVRKDGKTVPVALRVWAGEGEAGRKEYWAVIRDITLRKRNERIIEKSVRDLARSNEELKQFAYVASHDLQEPLRAMTGFSELLLERYGGKMEEDAHEFLSFIVDAAARMQQLINDLLSYSRLNTRAKPFESADIGEVIETAKLNLTALIDETGAQIETGPMPAVSCDRQQMTQLFQNLIGNAIKYRRPGEQPRVSITAEEIPGYRVFRVQDNGIGIKDEFLEVIFKVFQRLHTRDEYEGTGIGLAICRKIVERHGGEIWVESEYGKGARFSFTIAKEMQQSKENAGAW